MSICVICPLIATLIHLKRPRNWKVVKFWYTSMDVRCAMHEYNWHDLSGPSQEIAISVNDSGARIRTSSDSVC